MKLLFLLLFIITNASAMELAVCNGEFALCAASGAAGVALGPTPKESSPRQ